VFTEVLEMNYKLANIQKIVIPREQEKWLGNETALWGQDL
jgi:hypothetical protein